MTEPRSSTHGVETEQAASTSPSHPQSVSLQHIAVSVRDLDLAIERFRSLGLEFLGRELVPTEGAEVAFFRLGDAHLELVSPTSSDAPIARSLETRGEGLHHIALAVGDVRESMDRVRGAGLRVLSDEPKPGAGGSKIAFVHPKGLCGVLVELVEEGPGEHK